MEEDQVIGGKVRELRGARRTLSMDMAIAEHCDRSGGEDKDSELGTE